MLTAVLSQKVLDGSDYELRAAVGGEGFWHAEVAAEVCEYLYGTEITPFPDLKPVAESVHNHAIAVAYVSEEVSSDVLKRILWDDGRHRRHVGLRWCASITR